MVRRDGVTLVGPAGPSPGWLACDPLVGQPAGGVVGHSEPGQPSRNARHTILRASDDRPTGAHQYGALHQLGRRNQRRDHLIGGRNVVVGERQSLEGGVAPNEVGYRVVEDRDQLVELCLVQGLLQVLHHVHVDPERHGAPCRPRAARWNSSGCGRW